MNRYNAQILKDKGEYHLQFETDNKEHFETVEKIVQKCIDNKPLTNFDLITQSEESLAKFTGQFARSCFDCPWDFKCELERTGMSEHLKSKIIKWLQQEVQNDHNSLN